MGEDKVKGLLAPVAVLALFSIPAFVIPFNRNAVFWIAYGCGVLSVLFLICAFLLTFGREDNAGRFRGFPVAKAGIVWFAIQPAVSFLEIVLSTILPVLAAVVINVLIPAAVVTGCIRSGTGQDGAAKQEEPEETKGRNVN